MTNKILNMTFPHKPGAGGPGSFQIRFEKELKKSNWKISYGEDQQNPNIIFIVGGTRKIFWLWKMKRKGVPIIYRLDGIGWLHKKKKVSLKYYITAEFRNWLSKSIHGFLATKIVYQSQFVEKWWNKEGWRKRKNTNIIHNGVTIPKKEDVEDVLAKRKTKRLVILEGVIDYTPYAVKLLNDLAINLPEDIDIEVYGKFEEKNTQNRLHSRIDYKGFVHREDVYKVLMGSVYLSLDIHPACPNTVAEALACGAPVVAFDTGALPELVDETCGIIVPYGSNPWDLEYPDVKSLIKGIQLLFDNYADFSVNAYNKARKDFGLQKMLESYSLVIRDKGTI